MMICRLVECVAEMDLEDLVPNVNMNESVTHE